MKTTDLEGGYYKRVSSVADEISMSGFSRGDDLDQIIKNTSMELGIVEYKLSTNKRSTAWKEFVKDVKTELKKRKIKPTNHASKHLAFIKKQIKKRDDLDNLRMIAMAIDTAIGNSFPDGDPFDEIQDKVKKILGKDPGYKIMDYLNKASRKFLGSKNYDDHVKSVWQEYINDNGMDIENPW